MNYLMGIILGLFVFNSFADSTETSVPEGLIKLTKDENPKCVEFVMYKGEMYCTTTPTDNTPIDQKLLKSDKQIIQFDNRPWKAAWGKQASNITTIEYIVMGDDINNWKELITSQYIPDKDITPMQEANQFLNTLSKSGYTYTVHEIENTPTQLIYEFKVQKPENLQQDEIQKITKGKNGLYILHYVTKSADMDEANRQKWIDNLKASGIQE